MVTCTGTGGFPPPDSHAAPARPPLVQHDSNRPDAHRGRQLEQLSISTSQPPKVVPLPPLLPCFPSPAVHGSLYSFL